MSIHVTTTLSFTGAHDADVDVRFGAPGGSCRLTGFSQLCWALMDHVTSGYNYFTGKTGTRLDYFAIHSKGGKQGQGNSTLLYQNEKLIIGFLHRRYKELRNISIYNDESDPVVGWSKALEFRADHRYPAMVVKLIDTHLHSKDKEFTRFRMSSNDNAFLSYAPNYFTQRTLLAKFLVNNTENPYAVMVIKPIFSLMAMLAQVRGRNYNPHPLILQKSKSRGLILTFTEYQHMVTFWTSNDTSPCAEKSKTYTITPSVKMLGGYYVIRTLDNPSYHVWTTLGAPGNLSRLQTETLWNVTSVTITRPTTITREAIHVTMDGREGVRQLLLCSGYEKLNAPTNLAFHTITTDMILIKWDDRAISDCFLTYELEMRSNGDRHFTKVTENIILTRFHQYTSSYGVDGEYRVRSINILGQTSGYSSPVYHG